MDGILLYVAFIAPVLVAGLAAQWWLKKTFATHSEIGIDAGMSGAEVARRILDANGLGGVPVNPSPGGPLSDHYDPRSRGVYLSGPVFTGRSIASAAVAAHEVGHAIQHAKAYKPMEVRAALFPAVAFASSTWIFLLIAGAMFNALGLIQVAIALYALAVLFHFVTLPVEFDASRRAGVQLAGLGLVTPAEGTGARKVLTAAALTYVVGALAALAQLAYFVLAFLQE